MALPMRLLALAVLPLAGGCSQSESNVASKPTTTQSASASAAPAQLPRDGAVFALIQRSDGRTITWDQIDFNSERCETVQSEAVTYQQFFETCYTNEKPTLRTAPLDPAARVVVRPGNDPERTVGADQLPMEISAEASNDIPQQYRAWQLWIAKGRVINVEQATGASG